MEKKNQRQVVIITVSIILLLLVTIGSYAFVAFSPTNPDPQDLGVQAASLTLVYTDCADSNQADCANISADLNPGDEITKTFQVENTGTLETIYSMKFNSLINTFVDGELVYTVENIDTKEILINESKVPYSETEITNKIFLPAMSIGVGEIQRYKMTIKFLNTDYNQALNDNATFTIKLGITQKAPMLAASDTWFTQGGTSVKRSSITEINIVDNYEPAGTVTDTWDASKDKDGSVTAYVEGTVLTLSGNGLGVIYMNPDSNHAFSDTTGADYFSKLTTITNMDMLNTSKVVNLNRTFKLCSLLTSLDLDSWDTSKVEIMSGTFDRIGATSLNIENWDTGSVTDMSYIFQLARGLTELDLSKWDMSNVVNMRAMFMGHSSIGNMNLISIGDVSNWNTEKAEDMAYMFQLCTTLETLDLSNWNTGNVINMGSLFYNCTSLKEIDLTKWNVSNVEDMSGMFQACSSLEKLDLSKWNTAKVTDMNTMFYNCILLETLDVSKWNTSSVMDMSFLFYNCIALTELNLTNWNVSNVQDMSYMLCADGTVKMSLTTIGNVSNWNTSNVTTMRTMFQCCSSLKELNVSNWNTDKVTDMAYMFNQCSSIKELDLSNFKTTQVTDMSYMFAGMTGLEKVTLGVNFNFKGNGNTSSVLPTPASGYWYNSSGQALTPANVPSLKADTYYSTQQA